MLMGFEKRSSPKSAGEEINQAVENVRAGGETTRNRKRAPSAR
jgi:hypothetical protein